MGDRYILSVTCPMCGFEDQEAYYAPTCGFLDWVCPTYDHKVDLEKLTPEEKLLRVIFGESPKIVYPKCAKCTKEVKEPIHLNGRPYHLACLPYS